MIARTIGLDAAVLLIVAAATVAVFIIIKRRRDRRLIVRRRPSSVSTLDKAAEARNQVAALPVRRATNGEVEVLLISTRGSGRWTIPKGWPMRGRSDAEAAAQEAYEEAGVRGTIATEPLGTFAYAKRRNEAETLVVAVYRLEVERHVRRWRERGQRRQRWLPVSTAADAVAWPDLADLIRSLDLTRTL